MGAAMKVMGRREFVRYGAGLAGLLLLDACRWPRFAFLDPGETTGPVAEEAAVRAVDGLGTVADSRSKLAMAIDLGACIGCRTCQWTCKAENNIPDTISPPWIEVFELRNEVDLTGHPSLQELKEGTTTSYTESPREGRWYLPVQCYHCDNPPCVKVCPVGATYKDRDGLVLMDYDRCIGCRICVVACPYSARRFNWLEPGTPGKGVNPRVPVRPMGVVEKCTFCVHRVRRGELPRCVVECPVQARRFGDLNNPESEVSKMVESSLRLRLLQEANTHPSIFYTVRGRKWMES